MTMPVPKQLLIMRRLTAHLEQISATFYPDFGFPEDFNLAGAVYRGRTTLGPSDTYPALSILEAPNPKNGNPSGEGNKKRAEDWVLLVQGFVKDDAENPTDPAYELKAIVEFHLARLVAINERTGDPLFPDEYLLGKLITGLTIGQGVVRPPEVNVSPKAFFYIPLTVKLVTDPTKPYAD